MRTSRLDKLMYLVGVGGLVMTTVAFFSGNRIVLGIGMAANAGFLLYIFFQQWKKEKKRSERLKQ